MNRSRIRPNEWRRTILGVCAVRLRGRQQVVVFVYVFATGARLQINSTLN